VTNRSILLLDDDDDLRNVLRELFSTYDAGCLAVSSLDELIASKGHALSCKVALLDVNLGAGRPSGVDAYRWLREHSFAGQIVFLTAHARTYPSVAKAYSLGVKVLEKPVAVPDLLKLLDHQH
jgi:FixJ family two-component response regulator